MPFVVDASVAACWVMVDETSSRADLAYARLLDDKAIAPALWWFEVRNALLIGERRGRIDPSTTEMILHELTEMPIELDTMANDLALLALARRHRLSAYDAAYLELAMRRDLPLATLDEALLRAARSEGVVLIGDAS